MTSETNKENKSVLKIIISQPGNSNKYCGEMERKKKKITEIFTVIFNIRFFYDSFVFCVYNVYFLVRRV